MATDKITEIVDQSAFDQVVKLKTELKDLAGVFADLLKQTKPLTDGLNGVGKGGAGGVGATNKALNEMDKMLKQLATTREKIAESDSQVKLALEQEKIALQAVNKEIRDNIKFEKAQEGSVDQIRAKLGLLQRQYDSLGKTARESIGKDMLGNIQKLDTELKKIEGSTGRYQRNVGNYTNATFQLSQVIRELPAFTYSATTGVLSLSNNLPMLGSAFAEVRDSIGENGKKTGVIGALKIFGKSVFSLTNIFALAIGVFTIYSKEIFEFIGGAKEAAKTLDDVTDAQSSLSLAMSQTEYKSAIKNVEQLTINLDLAKRGFIDKDEVVKLYNETIGETIGKVSTLDEVEQQLVKNGPAYLEMMLLKAAANVALDKAAQKYVDAEEARGRKLLEIDPDKGKYGGFIGDIKALAKGEALEEAAVNNVNKFVDGIKKEGDVFKDISKQFQEDAERIKSSFGTVVGGARASGGRSSSRGGSSTENNRIADLAKQLKEAKDIQDAAYKSGEIAFYEYNSKLLYIASDFAVKLDAIQPSLSKKESEGVAQLKEDIVDTANLGKEGLQKILDEYKKESEEIVKQSNKNIKDLAKQQQAMAVSFPAVQLKKTLKEIIADISEVLQVAASVFGILGDWGTQVAGIIADKANSEVEKQIKNIDRVEKAQLMSLSRITMGTKEYEEAKRRIEVQAEARRQETEKKRITAIRKAAKIQKAADVASIISGTAAAIINALKTQPAALGIAYAAAAGITGGLQLARALAAPLPQYADGTDYHPTNEPFLAGEAGAEGVILPSGKRMLVDRPTIFPAGLKGTKVINNKDLMQSVYNSAIVKLATQGTVTTDKMQEALIQSLEEQAGKIDNVVKAVENLKLSVKFENFSEHINHVKQRTR